MADLDYYTCYTLFDITPTAVFSSYSQPFTDAAKQPVDSEESWERSRNQQRNWDTMVQIISMRAQPISLSKPKRIATVDHPFIENFPGKQHVWSFTFGVEVREAFRKGEDPVWALKQDSDMVPMSIGLEESADLIPACIKTDAYSYNTCFVTSNIS
jgi:hypothetical protein